MQFDKSFTSHFVDPSTWLPITGLTGVTTTILQRNDDNTYTKVVDTEPCVEIMEGWYHYVFSTIADKFYLYAIYPNDSRLQPESGFVDKRLNNLDQAVSDIRWGGWGSSINYGTIQNTIYNARDKIIEEMEKKKVQTIEAINDTNSHIDLVKTDISDKIDSIEIPEAILEEKEAKKAIKLIASVDKKISSYIDSEMKEKEEIGAIVNEFTKQEMEDKMKEKKEAGEKKKKELEEKKMEEEADKKLLEEIAMEFDKQDEEGKEEKKKELELEIKELEKEMKEKEKELKTL